MNQKTQDQVAGAILAGALALAPIALEPAALVGWAASSQGFLVLCEADRQHLIAARRRRNKDFRDAHG